MNEPAPENSPSCGPNTKCRDIRSNRPSARGLGRRQPCITEVSKENRADSASEWLIWQIADSAFPTGGFAHSGGLEAAWQQGEVRSVEELSEFMRTQLAQAGRGGLPFVNEAFWELSRLPELDRLCDAFLSNHVANRASRAQGQAFLLAAESAFGSNRIRALRAGITRQQLPAHFAPVFGSVARSLKLGHRQCIRLFLFLALRTLVSSAVRLGAIGPLVAQSLHARLAAEAERIASRSAGFRVTDAAQTSPLFDVWHAAHDRLYSRLFQT